MAKTTEGGRTSIQVDKNVIKETEKLMKELMTIFEIEADVKVSADSYENKEGEKEEYVDVKIEGEDIGVLIGYLGRNLRSLQRIVALMLNRRLDVNRDESEFVRVVLDVSGYREKRKESLEQLSDRIRQEVLDGGSPVDMRPMTSYERRVVHTHLTEYGDVTTESFGEGDERFVRVFPAGDVGKDKSEDEN
jgi:spoIIIJ-associated protein